MLHQNVKAQGFRVLNEDEIGAVCGGVGDITVTARRQNSFSGGGFNGTIENDFSYIFALAQGAADSVLDNLYNLPGFDWAAFEATNATPAQPPQPPAGAAPAQDPPIIVTAHANNDAFSMQWFQNQYSNHLYGIIGVGALGAVAGAFYSNNTGPGLFTGVGTPGPSWEFGRATDTPSYLTGWSAHQSGTPFGYGLNGTSQAASIGSGGASITYGMSTQQVFTQLDYIFSDFSNATYSHAGRPYDMPEK
jgi:hypothetical protein